MFVRSRTRMVTSNSNFKEIRSQWSSPGLLTDLIKLRLRTGFKFESWMKASISWQIRIKFKASQAIANQLGFVRLIQRVQHKIQPTVEGRTAIKLGFEVVEMRFHFESRCDFSSRFHWSTGDVFVIENGGWLRRFLIHFKRNLRSIAAATEILHGQSTQVSF